MPDTDRDREAMLDSPARRVMGLALSGYSMADIVVITRRTKTEVDADLRRAARAVARLYAAAADPKASGGKRSNAAAPGRSSSGYPGGSRNRA